MKICEVLDQMSPRLKITQMAGNKIKAGDGIEIDLDEVDIEQDGPEFKVKPKSMLPKPGQPDPKKLLRPGAQIKLATESRVLEIEGGFRIMVSEDEELLANKIDHKRKFYKEDLTEREQYLADQLVSKSIIKRNKADGRIYYTRSSPPDLPR